MWAYKWPQSSQNNYSRSFQSKQKSNNSNVDDRLSDTSSISSNQSFSSQSQVPCSHRKPKTRKCSQGVGFFKKKQDQKRCAQPEGPTSSIPQYSDLTVNSVMEVMGKTAQTTTQTTLHFLPVSQLTPGDALPSTS